MTNTAQPADDINTVLFNPVRPDVATREAQKILLTRKAPLFQRGHHLATVVTNSVQIEGWEYVFPVPFIADRSKLLDICSQFVDFKRKTKKDDKFLKVQPPKEVLAILSSSGGDGFPYLSRISNTPFLLQDGSLFDTPNTYEPKSGTFLGPSTYVPALNPKPSLHEAETAAQQILSLLSEFTFETDLDRAVALSGLLSPVLRSLYGACPIHCISSPTFGSGKSYYVTLASALAIGRPPAVISVGRDSDELDKRLEAALLESHPVISIDNANRTLNSDRLAQAAEQLVIAVRILGRSEIAHIINTACIYLNGVNIQTPADMARRTLTCRITQQEELPSLHQYQQNPLQQILAKRPSFLHATLTLGRFIIQNPTPSQNLGSFEKWAKIIPPICTNLAKLPDPIDAIIALQKEASIPDEDYEILAKLKEQFPIHFTVKDIRNRMEIDFELKELFLPIAGSKNLHVDATRIGHWLNSRKDKIINKLCLKRKGTSGGYKTWMIVNVLTK